MKQSVTSRRYGYLVEAPVIKRIEREEIERMLAEYKKRKVIRKFKMGERDGRAN